jgi:hypothetical protein
LCVCTVIPNQNKRTLNALNVESVKLIPHSVHIT